MVELIHPHTRDAIAAKIQADVDQFCKVEYNDGHRKHLGASLIGHKCDRYLWYVFRWVLDPNGNSGRMERLFNRGHETEDRFITWLRGASFTVWDRDENGQQFRISGVEGHFGGSLDGVCQAPPNYQIGEPLLTEFKTHNEKSFNKLVKEKVKVAKPQHYAQMCVYGAKNRLRYALYCAINKNTDETYFEIVELDWTYGNDLADRRAPGIILSPSPPPRLHETPTHFDCKFCDAFSVCHSSAPYQKNCRSCEFASPIKGGQWWCSGYRAVIPDDVIAVGCPAYHQAGRQK